MNISLIEVERWPPLRSKHTAENYDPRSQTLPLTITDGDVKEKQVPRIAYTTHESEIFLVRIDTSGQIQTAKLRAFYLR